MQISIEVNGRKVPVPIILLGIVVLVILFSTCNISVKHTPTQTQTEASAKVDMTSGDSEDAKSFAFHTLYPDFDASDLTVRDYIAIQVYAKMSVAYYEHGGSWRESYMRKSLPKAYEAADYFLKYGKQ